MSDKKQLRWEDETDRDRMRSIVRNYRDKLTPSAVVQILYPLEDYPCTRCGKDGLPWLVDHGGSEFGWEHGPDGGRSGCTRFGDSQHCGCRPRPGTATSLWLAIATGVLPGQDGVRTRYRTRTPEQYERAVQAVEKGWGDTHLDVWRMVSLGFTTESVASALGYTPDEVTTICTVQEYRYSRLRGLLKRGGKPWMRCASG